jgi:hypothetical protein
MDAEKSIEYGIVDKVLNKLYWVDLLASCRISLWRAYPKLFKNRI